MKFDANTVLNSLIRHGINTNFINDLNESDDLEWFLRFISNKEIHKMVKWINLRYIENELYNEATRLLETYGTLKDVNEYYYFQYVLWLLKNFSVYEVRECVKNKIEILGTYNTEPSYIRAEDIIDIFENSRIYDFLISSKELEKSIELDDITSNFSKLST
jgi:hypothetical protein